MFVSITLLWYSVKQSQRWIGLVYYVISDVDNLLHNLRMAEGIVAI